MGFNFLSCCFAREPCQSHFEARKYPYPYLLLLLLLWLYLYLYLSAVV